MAERFKILTPHEVLESRLQLGEDAFAVEGVPTGVFADRSDRHAYNRPALVFILDDKLICQMFCFKIPQEFWQPEDLYLLDGIITRRLREEGYEPLRVVLDKGIRGSDNEYDEYLAVAAACIDNAIRKEFPVRVIGALREDGIMEVDGLNCRQYSFYFMPLRPNPIH